MPKPMYHFFNVIEGIKLEKTIVIDRTLDKSTNRLKQFLQNSHYVPYTHYEYDMSMEKSKDGWYSITI
jgi:hypothetical protein